MGCTSSNEMSKQKQPEPTITATETPENTLCENDTTWTERRNSNKEKDTIIKQRNKAARLELGRRINYRTAIYAKCMRCGDMGPDHSNQYCGYYLIVPEIHTKSKCRRCNIPFSFEHYGVVKSIEEAIEMIIDELAE
jgi:hypothetical protein